MTTAIIFAILSAVIFLFLIYFLNLIVFVERENKRFQKEGGTAEYLAHLSLCEKKTKDKRKKNYLLYLRYRAHLALGETEQGEKLLPFLHRDKLLEIDPEKIA